MNIAKLTPWQDTLFASVEALGVPLQIVGDAEVPMTSVSAIRSAWRDCVTSHGNHDERHRIRVLDDATPDPARALADLSTQVTLAALDAVRGTRLLLHAAGVAAPDGRVLALVGPSGRGKTTAARHLGTRFGYVSDESVAVDDALTVWPYRKPLSVIVEGRPFKEQIAPSDLGLLPLPDAPLRLAGIALLERDPDADDTRIIPVDLIDAICEMTPQISYLPELPSPLQYVAGIVERIGSVTRLIYRDAADLTAVAEGMFAAAPPRAQDWSPAPRAKATGPWRCAEVDDAILVNGRACILREGVVTALDHRGCLVWTMCLEGAATDDIVRAAVATFGAPENADARELIEETLEALSAHGLLAPA
ncbi:hypothetical protein [Microbacterium sp. 1P10AE]|uniref:hypothetical protein n=1 Tax=Microbacterium sp. 1P10AE TaxID=3132286 RepID=UPI0039A1784F